MLGTAGILPESSHRPQTGPRCCRFAREAFTPAIVAIAKVQTCFFGYGDRPIPLKPIAPHSTT
ncbi:hypothetical protein [Altericista sp. CCNU0014]|uniref:hypothetical protein n=1 Tax=Altericista sp. CCNU0014 TaxID=3082949 RepID=UPI00384C41E3